jgi:hypothetical protein
MTNPGIYLFVIRSEKQRISSFTLVLIKKPFPRSCLGHCNLRDTRSDNIFLAFTACWSPYFLLMMMNSLNLIQNDLLIRVTSSLCYMNSLANPLIYWLFVTNFCLRCR